MVMKGISTNCATKAKCKCRSFIYDEKGAVAVFAWQEKKLSGARPKRKVLDTLITAEEYAKLFKLDDWNDVAIIAKGITSNIF